jgi:hypothetical protein
MASYLTSSTLIDTVKRIAMIPETQQTFTDADFLAFANQEMRIGLVPSVLQFHEEYFVRDSENITLVASQSEYAIPTRAIGGKFRDVFYRDSNGNLFAMTRINPEHRTFYQGMSNSFIFFYLKGNELVLVPDVSTTPTGSLVFSYFLRPNELVDEDRVGTITAITEGASTTVFTLDQIPSHFTVSSVYDMLQTNPGHKTIDLDITPTAIDTINKTITFDNDDLSSSIIVGDYIAFSGECIIPQVPPDLHDVLAQRVAMRCLQALGDQNGYGVAQSKLNEMEVKTGNLIDNRAEGHPQKVNNQNGLLRSARFRRIY